MAMADQPDTPSLAHYEMAQRTYRNMAPDGQRRVRREAFAHGVETIAYVARALATKPNEADWQALVNHDADLPLLAAVGRAMEAFTAAAALADQLASNPPTDCQKADATGQLDKAATAGAGPAGDHYSDPGTHPGRHPGQGPAAAETVPIRPRRRRRR